MTRKTPTTRKEKPLSRREEAITIFARIDRALPVDVSIDARIIAYNANYPWKDHHKNPPAMWYNLIDEHLEDLRKLQHWNGQ